METLNKAPVVATKHNKNHLIRQGVALTLAVGATAPVFAADGFDPSTIVTIITGFVAGVSAIGLAVLSLVVTGKVFKWVRTAL